MIALLRFGDEVCRLGRVMCGFSGVVGAIGLREVLSFHKYLPILSLQ